MPTPTPTPMQQIDMNRNAGADAEAIGIDRIGVYGGALSLDIATLCRARGLDEENFCGRFFCEQRSVLSPFEDVVTMAVNAAKPMLTKEDREAIELLIVATESAPDQEKPVSSWVHHYLGLKSGCRNFEVKHACYGATGAIQLAAGWLSGGGVNGPGARGKKALIINADHALMHLQGLHEPVLGAGAVAVLVAANPRIAAFDRGWNGVFAHDIADIFRPAPGVETGDADDSLLSYLDGVEHTYDAYVEAVGRPIDFDTFFAANVYHVPFGGLSQRAHLKLARRELGFSKAEAEQHWARKSKPSLTYNRRLGGMYGGATFVALSGLIAHTPHLNAGDRVGIYSYGSGSCAEFYSVTLAEHARETIAGARIPDHLDERRPLTVAEYEACERTTASAACAPNHTAPRDVIPGLFESHYAGRSRLVFKGTRNYFREYAWS